MQHKNSLVKRDLVCSMTTRAFDSELISKGSLLRVAGPVGPETPRRVDHQRLFLTGKQSPYVAPASIRAHFVLRSRRGAQQGGVR